MDPTIHVGIVAGAGGDDCLPPVDHLLSGGAVYYAASDGERFGEGVRRGVMEDNVGHDSRGNDGSDQPSCARCRNRPVVCLADYFIELYGESGGVPDYQELRRDQLHQGPGGDERLDR